MKSCTDLSLCMFYTFFISQILDFVYTEQFWFLLAMGWCDSENQQNSIANVVNVDATFDIIELITNK